MTVTELLAAIQAAYPGATAEALRTFVPVFHKRFRAREGEGLQTAADEVLATFNATARKPFPNPKDFEPHMPSAFKAASVTDGGPPIRAAMEARRERARRLYAAWYADQGLKIKAARHSSIYGACVLEVLDLARKAHERSQRIILTAEQISLCEMRALSAERAHRHRPARSNDRWDAQIGDIRAEWAQPKSEAA